MRRFHHTNRLLYFGALAGAVAIHDVGAAARRARYKEARKPRGARVFKALFITLPVCWFLYSLLGWLSVYIATAISPVVGFPCLIFTLGACFCSTLDVLRRAWQGEIWL